MSSWGISPNASEKEKIKADYADILHGMNSTGDIPYDVYSDLFDDGMELFDRMYEQGKADAVPVVHGRWVKDKTVQVMAPGGQKYHNRCSVCGWLTRLHNLNYCPNCGAKMGGENNG